MLSKESVTDYARVVLSQKGASARLLPIAADVAYALLSRAYYNEDASLNEVLVTPYVKKVIAERAGTKGVSPVNSGIKALVSCGLLDQAEPGVYRFTEEFLGKRDWRSITAIRIVKSFGEESRDVLEIVYPDGVDERDLNTPDPKTANGAPDKNFMPNPEETDDAEKNPEANS